MSCADAVLTAHNEARAQHAAGPLRWSAGLCEEAAGHAAALLGGGWCGAAGAEVVSEGAYSAWRHADEEYGGVADTVIALRAVAAWYKGGEAYRVNGGGARPLADSAAARAFAKLVWKSGGAVGVSVRRAALAEHDPAAGSTRKTTVAVVVAAYSPCCADAGAGTEDVIVRMNVDAGASAGAGGAAVPPPSTGAEALQQQVEALTARLDAAEACALELERSNAGLRAQVDVLSTRLRLQPPVPAAPPIAPGAGYVLAEGGDDAYPPAHLREADNTPPPPEVFAAAFGSDMSLPSAVAAPLVPMVSPSPSRYVPAALQPAVAPRAAPSPAAAAFASQREEDGRDLEHTLRLLEGLGAPSPPRQQRHPRRHKRGAPTTPSPARAAPL